MKKFIIISGTMGVGKTSVCKQLYKKIDNSVWLDGDWCWMMNPWNFEKYNKDMVIRNIEFILESYFENPNFECVLFSWVLHKQDIIDKIVKISKKYNIKVYNVSLICSEDELNRRLSEDNRNNVEQSLKNQKLYNDIRSHKIDTTNLVVDEVVEEIFKYVNNN